MKNIIVLGANGLTAQQIIPRLLSLDGIQLTLFVRQANQRDVVNHQQITIFEGDARDIENLKKAFQGKDIVINTMGGMDLDVKTTNVVNAMKELKIKRLIAINAGGIYDELPEPFNSWDKQMVGYTRPINLKTADIIENSSLEYTILRPVWLTNKTTENFELTQKGEIFKGTETSRASLGLFITDLIKNPNSHIRANLGISQPDTDGIRPSAYL